MFINGNSLLEASPIKDMSPIKNRFEGTSYGLSEAGYDIRIKQDIVFDTVYEEINGIRIPVSTVSIGNKYHEGNFILASAIEEFHMPLNLVGTVTDKSTWARMGLSVFNTVIEPGWNGFLTLELVYHGRDTLYIKAGQGIAQVLFGELKEERDYGEHGKYQNQLNKPVEARM